MWKCTHTHLPSSSARAIDSKFGLVYGDPDIMLGVHRKISEVDGVRYMEFLMTEYISDMYARWTQKMADRGTPINDTTTTRKTTHCVAMATSRTTLSRLGGCIASRGPLPLPLQPLPHPLHGISDHVEVYAYTSTKFECTCRRDE